MAATKDPLYCIHIPAQRNVGDACSAPHLYVPELVERFQINVISIANHDRIRAIPSGAPVILGGGGLLANKPHWDESIRIALERSGKLIAWGLGLNRTPAAAKKAPHALPDFVADFAMLGIRDVLPGTRWVPCASCLYSGFDLSRPPAQSKLGIYLHTDRTDKLPDTLRGISEDVPVMTNGGDKNSFGSVVDFLASCETVITNSFHGMYWSTLLGKKVLLFDIFSEKFALSRWTHPIYDPTKDLDAQFEMAPEYTGALAAARDANHAFRDDVLKLI